MSVRSLIESIGVYTPEQALSTEEVLRGCTHRPKVDLEELTGIQSRPVVGKGEYSIELAAKAISQCLKLSRHSPADIDMLASCSISRYCGPNYRFSAEPSAAANLAAQIGLSRNAITIDITNACAGMFTGILLADSLIKSRSIRRAIVVSGEYITHIMANAQREIGDGIDPQLASLTVGDAGAALILEATEDTAVGLDDIELVNLAKYCDLCIGTLSDKRHGGYVMYADSQPLLALGRYIAEHMAIRLKERHLGADDYDHFIIHQVASKYIDFVMQSLAAYLKIDPIPQEKVVDNVRYRGNTASTAHFVALWDFMKQGLIKSNSKILFGVGASGATHGVASCILDDLPDRVYRLYKDVERRNASHEGTRYGK
ncbi:MAG: hypothetical protein JXA30_15700 [Deltaproteobacteria bacterium]|nr:hypothetical protein [Deltaproteobacteria bacterium]